MKRLAFLAVISVLAGCGDFPRDQAGTLERVREQKVVRIGLIGARGSEELLRAYSDRIAAAAGARPQYVFRDNESGMIALENGVVDVVVGEFDPASPWSRRVHLLPPLVEHRDASGKVIMETTAAARNGENGWIMLLEREARAMTREP